MVRTPGTMKFPLVEPGQKVFLRYTKVPENSKESEVKGKGEDLRVSLLC